MLQFQFDYYQELSDIAGVSLKPVVINIMKDCGLKYIYELDTYRQHRFKILDDENFTKFLLK